MAWPMNVARKAPAIPSTVVRMNPLGLFGPGDSSRAMIPAIKPTMMTQIIPPMAFVLFKKIRDSDRHFVRTRQPSVRRQLVDHVGQMLAEAREQFVARHAGLRRQCVDLVGA